MKNSAACVASDYQFVSSPPTTLEQEEAEELIDVQYDGPEMEVGFNVSYARRAECVKM